MTTRDEFITTLRATLSDGSTFFSAADLIEFLNLAIKEYQNHFPRLTKTEITTTDGTYRYTIGDDQIRDVLLVEYPADADPSETTILRRGNWTAPDFFSQDGLYDIIEQNDSTINDAIILSQPTTADLAIWITHLTNHGIPASGSSELTVPIEHEPLLIAYCTWRAYAALMNNEQMAPTSANALLSSQFGENANRAWNTYEELRKQYLAARSRSRSANWRMDKWDI